MIKYKGFTVSPTEVGGVLFEHPAVADCTVVGKPDPQAGELPIAYVVLKEGQSLLSQELKTFVAERVAGYKKIREVHIVHAIPRNSHGKTVRRTRRECRPSIRTYCWISDGSASGNH